MINRISVCHFYHISIFTPGGERPVRGALDKDATAQTQTAKVSSFSISGTFYISLHTGGKAKSQHCKMWMY